MSIGMKIKTARINKNLTQEQLGRIIGVQKSAIAKYENGRVVNIKRSTLQKIAKVLDLKPSELIFGDAPKDAANLHVKIISDFQLLDAIKDYYKLSPANQKVIRDLIHNLSLSQAVSSSCE